MMRRLAGGMPLTLLCGNEHEAAELHGADRTQAVCDPTAGQRAENTAGGLEGQRQTS